jgi:hypothetical protein
MDDTRNPTEDPEKDVYEYVNAASCRVKRRNGQKKVRTSATPCMQDTTHPS